MKKLRTMENNTIPGRIALELDYNVGYCKMIKLWKEKNGLFKNSKANTRYAT